MITSAPAPLRYLVSAVLPFCGSAPPPAAACAFVSAYLVSPAACHRTAHYHRTCRLPPTWGSTVLPFTFCRISILAFIPYLRLHLRRRYHLPFHHLLLPFYRNFARFLYYYRSLPACLHLLDFYACRRSLIVRCVHRLGLPPACQFCLVTCTTTRLPLLPVTWLPAATFTGLPFHYCHLPALPFCFNTPYLVLVLLATADHACHGYLQPATAAKFYRLPLVFCYLSCRLPFLLVLLLVLDTAVVLLLGLAAGFWTLRLLPFWITAFCGSTCLHHRKHCLPVTAFTSRLHRIYHCVLGSATAAGLHLRPLPPALPLVSLPALGSAYRFLTAAVPPPFWFCWLPACHRGSRGALYLPFYRALPACAGCSFPALLCEPATPACTAHLVCVLHRLCCTGSQHASPYACGYCRRRSFYFLYLPAVWFSGSAATACRCAPGCRLRSRSGLYVFTTVLPRFCRSGRHTAPFYVLTLLHVYRLDYLPASFLLHNACAPVFGFYRLTLLHRRVHHRGFTPALPTGSTFHHCRSTFSFYHLPFSCRLPAPRFTSLPTCHVHFTFYWITTIPGFFRLVLPHQFYHLQTAFRAMVFFTWTYTGLPDLPLCRSTATWFYHRLRFTTTVSGSPVLLLPVSYRSAYWMRFWINRWLLLGFSRRWSVPAYLSSARLFTAYTVLDTGCTVTVGSHYTCVHCTPACLRATVRISRFVMQLPPSSAPDYLRSGSYLPPAACRFCACLAWFI